MILTQVFDTHRLSYRNAVLRAFSLANPTTRINFYDKSQAEPAEFAEAYTNENGYICRGEGRQPVNCLAIGESAIIQVSLDGGQHFGISWIFNKDAGTVERSEVAKLFYYDSTDVAFDPLGAPQQYLHDFLERSEVDLNNRWEESAVFIEDSDTNAVSLTTWTKLVIIKAGITLSEVSLDASALRDGQAVFILNYGKVRRINATHGGLPATQEFVAGQVGLLHLTYPAEDQGTHPPRINLLPILAEDDTEGRHMMYQRLSDDTTWESNEAKINWSAQTRADADHSDRQIQPYGVAFTRPNGTFRSVKTHNGLVRSMSYGIQYQGSGIWKLVPVQTDLDPAWAYLIDLKQDNFPGGNPFGSYNGTNDLNIDLPLAFGVPVRVIIKVSDDIIYADGLTHTTKIRVNGCEIFSQTVSRLSEGFTLTGTTERFFQEAGHFWFFWNADTEYKEIQV